MGSGFSPFLGGVRFFSIFWWGPVFLHFFRWGPVFLNFLGRVRFSSKNYEGSGFSRKKNYEGGPVFLKGPGSGFSKGPVRVRVRFVQDAVLF